MAVYFFGSINGFAEILLDPGRVPANFVPDDDIIIVPVVVKKNFIDEFHEKHEDEFFAAKRKLRLWIRQEQYAQDYGLEDTGIIQLPTSEEKERFFRRNYLRFISKDMERSTNSSLQRSWEEWTTDDEIDAIKTLELHQKVIVRAKKNRGRKTLKKTTTLNVGKKDFKFGFHPRIEIGMLKFTLESSFFEAKAWVGANGNQEVNIERTFKSTRSSVFANYYIDDLRLLASFDQGLTRHWVLRLTHVKEFDGVNALNQPVEPEDNIFQLRFNMGF